MKNKEGQGIVTISAIGGSLVSRRVVLQESYTTGADPCFPFAGRLHIRSLGPFPLSLINWLPMNSTFGTS